MTSLFPPPAPKKKKRRSLLLRFLGFAFASGVVVFLAGSAVAGFFLWKISRDLPSYEGLAQYEPPVMTRSHAHDGSLIAEYARERRIYVPINTVPKLVIRAFLSAEDKNFFEHGGIDFRGILRAVIVNVKNYGRGRRLVGASTITQQVAKNFLLSKEQKLERKLKEAVLAIRIERAYSKEKILELYLNQIYLGLHSYGVAAAALNYFGKKLDELTIADAAYLAALPKAPNNYHPFRRTKAAIERRNWVIGQMTDNGVITREQAREAMAQPLDVKPRLFGAHIFAAEFFAEEVRRELITMYGEKKVYGGGLSVRTTLDPKLQRIARKALVDGLVRYDRRHGWRGAANKIELSGDWGARLAASDILSDVQPWRLAVVLEAGRNKARIGLRPSRMKNRKLEEARETGTLPLAGAKWALRRKPKRVKARGVAGLLSPGDVVYVAPKKGKKGKKGTWKLMQIPKVEGAIVVMDPHTGRVLALVGGFSFAESQFDRAIQAMRQPGSAFKPFVYAAALDNNYTPASIVLDAPIVIDQGPGQDAWKPKNYGKKFYGPSTLRLGVEKSRNLMTVRLAQDIGMPYILEYADRFGIYDKDKTPPLLSTALGARETSLLRLTNAYSILANGGKEVHPTLIDRIQDRYGRTIWRHDQRVCPDCRADSWNGQDEPKLKDVRRQIIDPHTAYQITSILDGVVQRGTGYRVRKVGKPLAGKTGTTNDEKDAWFMGFSPDLAAGVFVGFDSPKPMGHGETGGSVASPIFRDFMMMALKGRPAIPFRIPPGIKLVRINRKTGLRAAPGDTETILEAFKPNTEPPDVYSIIGYSSGDGFNAPERAIGSGRGLY